MADQAQAAAHWDAAYAQGDDTRSWYEEHPAMSLRMLDCAGISAADALIDVGGGASPLTGVLLDRGFRDLTVLDISAAGMQHVRGRLGSRADQVHWLTADVLSWHPQRHYQAWHDRAAYHFLTTEEHAWHRGPGRPVRQRCHLSAVALRAARCWAGCDRPDVGGRTGRPWGGLYPGHRDCRGGWPGGGGPGRVCYGDPPRQEYNDLWVIRFGDDGRCTWLEEWPYWPGRSHAAHGDLA